MVHKKSEVLLEKLKSLKWEKLFHMFYIEPIVMALIFSHALSGTIIKNQVIYQACTTIFDYSDSDCKQLGTKNASDYANQIETEIQPYIANLFMIRTLLESIVPAVCGIFIGSWADYYGRKPLLLISMIGFSFTYVITCIICELSLYYPVNPWYYIIAVVPHSLLGGNCVFSVAAFCFISDVTDTKTRPYRMLFFEAVVFVALTSGHLLSSYVYEATSSSTVFAISGALMCSATAFVAICVPETLHMKREQEEMEKKMEQNEQANKKKNNNLDPSMAEKCCSGEEKEPQKEQKEVENEKTQNSEKSEKVGLFSTVHVKDMFSTCMKKREYYDREIIWLVTGTMFIVIFIMDGAMGVFYLYVREKFHWNVRDFTFYETFSHIVPMVGAIFGVLILRKLFSFSVVTLAILSFASDVISCVIRGFAENTWHMYLAVGFGAFRSISGPMCRTIVSNIVPATDLGKIFSIKNVLQSFAPFLAAPLYTFIYQRSLKTFPGLFFIVSAFLYCIALVFMITVLRFKLRYKDYYAKLLK